MNPKQDLEIIERCMWYSQLIQLELNHIYKSWYDQEPPLILRPALRTYLQENEKKYYDRIKSFHRDTTLQKYRYRHSHPLRPAFSINLSFLRSILYNCFPFILSFNHNPTFFGGRLARQGHMRSKIIMIDLVAW